METKKSTITTVVLIQSIDVNSITKASE